MVCMGILPNNIRPPLPNITRHSGWWPYTVTLPLIIHYTNFWPLLIWILLPNLIFYLIVQGFHRTCATGAACQQRTLSPPDTWSCPTLKLAFVLMSRPISLELVLFPDSWVSNILGTSLLHFQCNMRFTTPITQTCINYAPYCSFIINYMMF